MHFPIIKIEDIDTPVEDWDIDLPYDDPTLNYHTDYYGELYTEEERKLVINSPSLKELFRGIATIDTKEETITFLDKNTISNTLREYFKKKVKELFLEPFLTGFHFRQAGSYFRDCNTMFVKDYAQTSLDFVEDAVYRAGKTYKIGNIFDAHY